VGLAVFASKAAAESGSCRHVNLAAQSGGRPTPTTDTIGERFKVHRRIDSTLNNGRKPAPVEERVRKGSATKGGNHGPAVPGPGGFSTRDPGGSRPQARRSHLRGLSSAWRNRVQSNQCVKRTKVPYFTDFHWLLRVKLSMKKMGQAFTAANGLIPRKRLWDPPQPRCLVQCGVAQAGG